MQCHQCSTEIPDGSGFCNRCGAGQEAGAPAKPFAAASAAPPGQPSEQTLWTGRYSFKDAAHLWILSAVWIALVLWLYLRFVQVPTQKSNLIAFAVALVPVVLVLGQALVRKLSLRYRLTNHRLFTVRGLLARQHDELELIRVDDVSVRQNLLQRVFDVGTVTVLSTDSSNPVLAIQGVERPLELKERIRGEVRARRARTTFLETL